MRHIVLATLLAAAATIPAAAEPIGFSQFVQTGTFGDMTWEARSLIVGGTPTRDANPPPPTHVGGGDPLFRVKMPAYNGIPALIMDYGVFTGGPNVGLNARFICTGSNLTGGYILTAAHCVNSRSDTTLASPVTTAYFFGGDDDIRIPFAPQATAVVASQINLHPGYTGQVIDHNDIAVLKLDAPAPAWARTYAVANLPDMTGVEFNVAGYGNRSIVGGFGPTGGATAGTTGFLRQGDNIYDYAMGNPLFSVIPGNGWQTVFPNNPNIEFSWLSDFDNGLAVNDMACRVAQAANLGQAAGAVFCDTGLGATEVSVAGGDSGGPQFVNGRIASITSYGLTFGSAWGDCRTGLQSSCGEFNGFVPTFIHLDWIREVAGRQALPSPGTWAMLALGLGLVAAARRQPAR